VPYLFGSDSREFDPFFAVEKMTSFFPRQENRPDQKSNVPDRATVRHDTIIGSPTL
jgi:hypothetical protein